MRFCLVDASAGATTSNGEAMTPAVLARIAQVATVYLNRDVAAEWGGSYEVRDASGAGDIQPGETVFAILATLPNAPGAIAYHDVTGVGVPVLFDGLTLSDSLIGPGNSVSVAITHELAETVGDVACNTWRDAGDGKEYAQELCDACEGQSYDLNGVSVSNFVLDAFFIPGSPGPYDQMGALGLGNVSPAGPFQTVPGGNYQIVRTAGTDEHQVQRKFDVTVSLTIPFGMTRFARRAPRRALSSSRAYRRGVR